MLNHDSNHIGSAGPDDNPAFAVIDRAAPAEMPVPRNLVEFDSATDTFFLHAGGATYAFGVSRYGILTHLYWGASIASQALGTIGESRDRPFSPNPIPADKDFSLETMSLEYPVYGNSDFRSPALEVLHPATGSRILDLRYASHRIARGKPPLPGLPASYTSSVADAATLTIQLRDETAKMLVELSYTAFRHHPVIARSARIINEGAEAVVLRRVLSCSLDFPARFSRFHFVHLHGAWARETQVAVNPLRPGLQAIESRRGASSHAHNPFFALTELGADEEHGEAYGFNLVYSGNFVASVEVDPYSSPRVQLGINPFDFSWQIKTLGSFQSPESIMVFSGQGLGGMSRAFHRFYRASLLRGPWRHRPRPILINNWEATYFDFDADKIEAIAADAAALGVELFVLDDGWFGQRDNDRTSLGDWVPHRTKLPRGLPDLVARVRRHGLEFGLWFEPEMISVESDFYRAHPDWCLHVADRPRTEGRSQLIADLSRAEVCQEIYTRVASVLRSAPISYVKWDMNRNMTEIGSAKRAAVRQQETAHRYMLGLYGLLERFQQEFPDVLFEGCSGGGGRFDPGILHYMPQIWTSDNSDAIARLRIQYGASFAYPYSSLSAHVSASPNHQVGRTTPFRTRGHVAFTGSFGYELDSQKLGAEERAEARAQILLYKKVRHLLIAGDLYRLSSPFTSNVAAWMIVSEDCRDALVTHVRVLGEANTHPARICLRGLDPASFYRIDGETEKFRGDFLMRVGLPVPDTMGDFCSAQWYLRGIRAEEF